MQIVLTHLCDLDNAKAFTKLESFSLLRSPKPVGCVVDDTNPVRLFGLIDSFQTNIYAVESAQCSAATVDKSLTQGNVGT